MHVLRCRTEAGNKFQTLPLEALSLQLKEGTAAIKHHPDGYRETAG